MRGQCCGKAERARGALSGAQGEVTARGPGLQDWGLRRVCAGHTQAPLGLGAGAGDHTCSTFAGCLAGGPACWALAALGLLQPRAGDGSQARWGKHGFLLKAPWAGTYLELDCRGPWKRLQMRVGTGGQEQLGKHQQPVRGPQKQDCDGVELPGLLLKGGWQL